MRHVLCIKIEQRQILPGLPETYYPQTGSGAHEKTARLCYAVGAEKALLQAVFRARIWRGKGFIPYPPKPRFYCVTNPTKRSDEAMAVFRVEKNKGYTVMSNHHLRNKELSLKAKGLLSQMLSLPEIGTTPLQGCPLSTGKVSTLSALLYGSLKKPDISQGGRDATRKAK